MTNYNKLILQFLAFIIFIIIQNAQARISVENVHHRSILIREEGPYHVNVTTIGDRLASYHRTRLTFYTSPFPSFRVSRWGSETDDIVGLSIRVGLVSLIEYKESGVSLGLDAGDRIVSRFPLWNSDSSAIFEPLKLETEIEDDLEYFSYSTSSSQTTGPIISIRNSISDLRGWLNPLNKTLSPHSWKWGLSVNGYPYQETGTNLALKVFIETPGNFEERETVPTDEREEPTVPMAEVTVTYSNDNDDNFFNDTCYFAWEKTFFYKSESSASYKEGNVIYSGMKSTDDVDPDPNEATTLFDDMYYGARFEEERHFVYFAFDSVNPEVLIWDPYVGIEANTNQDLNGSIAEMNRTQWILILLLLILIATILVD